MSPSLVQGYVGGGDEDQPPGGRRSHGGAVADHLLRARPAGARQAHRGAAARHARRPARHASRSRSTPSTSSRVGGRRGGGLGGTDARRHDRRRAAHGAQPAQLPPDGHRRPARHRRSRSSIGSAAPAWTRASPTSAIDSAFTPPAACRRVTITGPFNADRHRRHAEPADGLRLPPGGGRRGDAVRAAHRLGAGAARVPPAADGRGRRHADGLLSRRAAQDGDFETGIQHALARILVAPKFVFRTEEEPAGAAAGRDLRHQRPRAGVAALVLPLEQHSRRPAARPGRARAGCRTAPCSRSRCARMLADPKADALVAQLRRASGSTCASSPTCSRRRGASTTTCASRSAARPSCSSTASCARTGSLTDAARRRLHVRGRAARAPLRHPERLRQLLPPGDAGRPTARAAACSGHGSMLTVTSIATRTSPVIARQVGAREPARHAAAAAAARASR